MVLPVQGTRTILCHSCHPVISIVSTGILLQRLNFENFDSVQLNPPIRLCTSPSQQERALIAPCYGISDEEEDSHHRGMSCIKSMKWRRQCLLHIDAYQP